MSDSDETVGCDSDETLPPSDLDVRACYSPDLFDDEPEETNQRNTMISKHKMEKHQSKTHDISDSDSEDESRKHRDKHSGNSGKPQKQTMIPTDKTVSKRKAFIDDFLNMTDSDEEKPLPVQRSSNGSSCVKSEDRRLEETKLKLERMKKHQERDKDHHNYRSPVKKSSGSDNSVKDRYYYSEKPHKKNYSKPFQQDQEKCVKDKHSSNGKSSDLDEKDRCIKVDTSKSRHTETHRSDSPSTNSLQKTPSDSPQSLERKKIIDQRSFLSSKHSPSSHAVGSLKRKHSDSSDSSERTKTDQLKDMSYKYSPKPRSDSLMERLKKRPSDSQLSSGIDCPSVGSLKRKHSLTDSKMKVPNELRKAVTEILQQDTNGSTKTSAKKPCQYGSKCYRKNPSHFEEYSHPDDQKQQLPSSTPPKKKQKIDSEQPSTSKIKPREYSPSGSKVVSLVKVKDKSRSSKVILNPQSIQEKFDQAQPYSFFLTRVEGIKDKYNATFVMDIKDILCEEMGTLTASCQFNYMFDIQWLMKQYPARFRSKPLMVVHGEKGPSMASLQAQAMSYDNIRFCQAKLDMMYGTHHTKMMLLLYEEGMRIVIHTSNLIQQDWFKKTQGMWISPIFPRLDSPSKEKGDSSTHFKRDLIDYLAAYRAYQLKDWVDHIAKHDMSAARVVIIGSVPGRHIGDKPKSMWGHLKLRRALHEHGPTQGTVKTWPVIGQFSSIGSMGPSKDNWLCGEWLQSLSGTRTGAGPQTSARLQLIFPSKDNVRLSLEGYPAGGSIPYSVNTAKKQTFLYDFFHIWKSESRGRTRAMPHIKTYMRPTQDGSKASWFVATSANLSKAAWGALEKKGAQLMIRSYEIGVLFLPKFFDGGEEFEVTSDPEIAATHNQLLLPYDLPTSIYENRDRAWMWDIPYMDLPDTNGNVWCPFSK